MNLKITKINESTSNFEFLVEVNSDEKTEHKVTIDKNYLNRLMDVSSERSAQKLLKKSFNFLLERESNKSILPKFNLKIISKYFPEYISSISN